MLFNGLPEMNVENVTVSNTTIEAEVGAEINESTNVALSNVTIVPRKGAALKINNAKNVSVADFNCPEESGLVVTGSRNKAIVIDSDCLSQNCNITDKAKGEVIIK